MNIEQLLEFLESEIKCVMKESTKASAGSGDDKSKFAQWTGQKMKYLSDIVASRDMNPKEIAALDCAFSTKETILSLFDQKVLIAEMLKK
jgi:hypothetical protein